MKKLKALFIIFISFFKIGLFTIGGGLAMIPLIEKEVVEKKKWMNEDDMVDCVVISQALPGVIAINAATYVGNKRYGVLGAIFATIGVILPSFIIILIFVNVLGIIGDNHYIEGAFVGIKAAVCGLITVTCYRIGKRTLTGIFQWIVGGLCFIVIAFFGITTIWAILVSAIAGIIYNSFRLKRGVKE